MSLSRRAFMTIGSALIATVSVSTAAALGYEANGSTVDKT
jgi:hypothetical protein